MSYYYQYYIGYKHNGKFYPWGPYDSNHVLKPVICRSKSFASDLHTEFCNISKTDYSPELLKEFKSDEYLSSIKYLPIIDLPNDSYIKTGYCLIKEVENYINSDDHFDNGFSSVLTPEIYAVKLQHEIMFGKNVPTKDEEGYEYCEPNASDYMYYAYVDEFSKEYEAFLIKQAWSTLLDYNMDVEWVVLETEG